LIQAQFLTAPTAAPQSYADTINQQFYKSKSHYVSLDQRLVDTIGNDRYRKTVVSESVNEFLTRNPNFSTWSDFKFCRCEQTTLDKIVIDITLQRMLNIIHACGILDKFQQIRVMPISVYEDTLAPGKFVCWDGQHTAIVLLLIAAYALKLDPAKCQVPIVVYESSQKAEMRENFMELNGDAKLPLDLIDYFHQMVFGVRTDKSKNSEWLIVESKQQALEKAGIFATHLKFGDTDQAGALSRLEELMDTKNYDLIITQQFCKYFTAVCGSSRPVQPKEVWMLYEYFRLCQKEGITVNDAYIAGVAKSLQFENGDFDPIKLANRAKTSYQQHWINNNLSIDGSLRGITYPERRLGLTFLIEQIKKNFSGTVPKGNPLWTVPSTDLF
jgi:hypothetical protein